MSCCLFVYGTLKSSHTGIFGRDKRDRLQRESRMLGAATLPGRLYDLGDYPGLIVSDTANGLVHGEVVELSDPGRSFLWLDAYEGIRPDAPQANEYRREQHSVRLVSGAELMAWVYIYAQDVSAARLVTSGTWRATR